MSSRGVPLLTVAAAVRVGVAILCGVLFCGVSSATAGQAQQSTVPTVRCHTAYGMQGTHPTIPARITVRGNPTSVRGLVAYSDPYAHLVGPAGMQCSAIAAVDGSQNIIVWPKGQREPRAHSAEQGLNLQVIPACVGCMYSLVCPLSRSLANEIYPGYPVSCTKAPEREQIERDGNLLLFTDPPGVAGDGAPSGGPYLAYGAVGWTRNTGAFTASCTLPDRERSTCTTSLNDAIAVFY